MNRFSALFNKHSLLTILAALLITTPSWAYEKITSNGGGARVEAKPLSLTLEKQAEFQLRFNSHSVDFDQDLLAVTELVDDTGRQYSPTGWDGSPPGNHHRKGQLSFPKIQKPASSVILIIRGVAGVAERKFEWQLK